MCVAEHDVGLGQLPSQGDGHQSSDQPPLAPTTFRESYVSRSIKTQTVNDVYICMNEEVVQVKCRIGAVMGELSPVVG